MSTITTYTGRCFDPTQAVAEDIRIRDIAHALSLMCRANGHFPHFYSVAQHCVNCVKEAKARGYSERVQLGCLLHDASEAYLSDITRPVKEWLPYYRKVERRLQNLIYEQWLSPLPTDAERELIAAVDDALLYYEFKEISGREIQAEPYPQCGCLEFEWQGFSEMEEAYLQLFQELTGIQS